MTYEFDLTPFHSKFHGSVKNKNVFLFTSSIDLIVGDERSKRRKFETPETWSKWSEEENWEDDQC